jgi:hypothetical protein
MQEPLEEEVEVKNILQLPFPPFFLANINKAGTMQAEELI